MLPAKIRTVEGWERDEVRCEFWNCSFTFLCNDLMYPFI